MNTNQFPEQDPEQTARILSSHWKNKAEESQNRIYININLNTDTASLEEKIQELKEEIADLKGSKKAQVTFNYSTEDLDASTLAKKIQEYIDKDF